MSHRASYLVETGEARDRMDWNPEWSRRARGIATYAAIRQLGRAGIAALVDRTSDHARAIATGIGALPGAETIWISDVNQGSFASSIRARTPPPPTTTDAPTR